LIQCHVFGGDEFVLVLGGLADDREIKVLLDKLLAEVAVPMIIEGNEAHVTGSIGVALFPRNADSVEDLLEKADKAMYFAKTSGKSCYQFFDDISE